MEKSKEDTLSGRFPFTGFVNITKNTISIIDDPIRFDTGIEMRYSVIVIDMLKR